LTVPDAMQSLRQLHYGFGLPTVDAAAIKKLFTPEEYCSANVFVNLDALVRLYIRMLCNAKRYFVDGPQLERRASGPEEGSPSESSRSDGHSSQAVPTSNSQEPGTQLALLPNVPSGVAHYAGSGKVGLGPVRVVPRGNRAGELDHQALLLTARRIFDSIDTNKDGSINKRELILALRKNPETAAIFHLPQHIRQEDGTRDDFEKAFQTLDSDQSREISWEEFLEWFENGDRAQTSEQTTLADLSKEAPPDRMPETNGDVSAPRLRPMPASAKPPKPPVKPMPPVKPAPKPRHEFRGALEAFIPIGPSTPVRFGWTVRCRYDKGSGDQFYVILHVAKVKCLVPVSQLRSELQQIVALQHPLITRMHGFVEDATSVQLVYEASDGGLFFDQLTNRTGSLSEMWVCRVMQQVLTSVSYAHACGVQHLSLQPDDLSLSTPHDDGSVHVMVNHFGLSDLFSTTELTGSLRKRIINVGGSAFMSPEVLSSPGAKSDVWACGVLMFLLITGSLPFWGRNYTEVATNFRSKEIDWEGFAGTTPAAIDLCKSMLASLDSRPSAEQCLEHDWFNADLPDYLLPTTVWTRLSEFGRLESARRMALQRLAADLPVRGLEAVTKIRGSDSQSATDLLHSVGASDRATELVSEWLGEGGRLGPYEDFIAAGAQRRRDELDYHLWKQFVRFDRADLGTMLERDIGMFLLLDDSRPVADQIFWQPVVAADRQGAQIPRPEGRRMTYDDLREWCLADGEAWAAS